MQWRPAVRMAAEVASALASAHDIGVVHRDIKPRNIMLTVTGAKVVDFGIAALIGGPAAPAGSPLLGTPTYTAPERLAGSSPAPANDVYSLGAVLYQALTGEPPSPAVSWQEAATAHDDPATIRTIDIPGMPVGVGEICLRCLSADPADRPTATQLADVDGDPGDPRGIARDRRRTGALIAAEASPATLAGRCCRRSCRYRSGGNGVGPRG